MLVKIVRKLLVVVVVLMVHSSGAQNNGIVIDSIILNSKNFNFQSANVQVREIQQNSLRSLFIADIVYQQKGFLVNSDSLQILDLKGRKLYVGRYLFAEIIEREEKGKDSLVYNLYIQSLEEAKAQKDTLVLNEIYRRLNLHLFRNSNELKTFKKYVDESKTYAKDSLDQFYLLYYKIGYQMLLSEKKNEIDTLLFERLYQNAKIHAKRPYLLGYICQFESIFYGSYLKNLKRAFEANNSALKYYDRENFYLAKRSARSVRFNMGVDYFHLKDYANAIPFFLNDIKTQKNQLYLMYGYDWLYKSYDALKKHDSAYFYFKKMIETKDRLDRLKHAREIKRIEVEFDINQKENELAILAKEKTSLQNNFYTLLPILGVVSIVLIIIFFLYKRYKKKSVVLEDEKSETLQKLDELKSIVIKNHIVLKDKTKIYISDLMYVKSDDHYLNVFTSDDKSHFVRGKLSNIRQELPPNFIQCHRSYIVNSNFIKRVNNDSITLIDKTQIPLSRSYRNKF